MGTVSWDQIKRSRPAVLGLLAVVLFSLLAFMVWDRVATGRGHDEAPQDDSGEFPRSVAGIPAAVHGHPGFWGDLEYVRTELEIPDQFVSVNEYVPGLSRWYFKGFSRERVKNLLDAVDLSPAQRQAVYETAKWEAGADGCYVTPSTEFVLALTPKAREQIYSVLAPFPENPGQCYPWTFRDETGDEWFARSGLSRNTTALMRGLLYRRGHSVLFSDLAEALSEIDSLNEKIRLIKTLSRQPTLLMQLRIAPGTDVARLANYWGAGGRAAEIRPLLDALASLPQGGLLDVSHLLPPFARARLYTFPNPQTDPAANQHDCFWTSMNFFNDLPQNRFSSFQQFWSIVQEEYFHVTGPMTYGDMVFFINSDKKVLHTAIYVADDVLFTKNGGNFRQPWTLMGLSDVLACYPSAEPLRVVAFRKKGWGNGGSPQAIDARAEER
jgi:hypothetical protein